MQSNVGLVIEEKAADIGNFMVGRLLPFRKKRAVGPFVFIDHMGPACLEDHQNLDVPPHPHIGLSTLTYLLEGAIHHRDSLGNSIEILPGAVNWMTAGKGIRHSERTPQRLRSKDKFLHGFQLWIALPKELEESNPTFNHTPASDIPHWIYEGVHYKLIAGKIKDIESPVPVHSPMYFLEIKSNETKTVAIGDQLYGETALYVLKGEVEIEGNRYGTKQLLVAKESTLCNFKLIGDSVVYIFGGEALAEERFMFWNFVSSDKEKLEQAKRYWKDQNTEVFPLIPEDNATYVPLPEPHHKIKNTGMEIKRTEDEKRGKFTIYEDHTPAGEMTYVWAGSNKFIIDHTGTFEGYSGKGYGKKLVHAGVAFAREREVKIIPLCPYAKKVIEGDESLHDVLYR